MFLDLPSKNQKFKAINCNSEVFEHLVNPIERKVKKLLELSDVIMFFDICNQMTR